jgi:DNA-3-methyladenine glycosylase II
MTRLSAAAAHIVKVDPKFRRIVDTSPPMTVRPDAGSAFESLLSAIVFQQLAGAAARAIHGRLVTALGGAPVAPEAVLTTKPETMRAAGLSANKLAAIIDLATKFVDGTVPTDDLEHLSDDEIVARLVTIRGVGRWTAEMFLLFRLGRPDVWPIDDLGVRNGWARIHNLEKPPTAKELGPLGDPFRPYRSTAAWYCWRGAATVLLVPSPAAKPARKAAPTAAGRRPPSRPKKA